MIPQPADCYLDRDVAARLAEAVEQDGTVVLTQVLTGMGGVGKTQLAAAYARKARAEGVGVLVWAAASSRDAVVSAYASAALRLRLPLADRNDPEQAAREFLTWTDSAPHPWWLVVLDDVQDLRDLAGLWPPAATSAAGGEIVITTRLREAAISGASRKTVTIGTFTPDEARSYLRAKLGHRATVPTEVDALAEELGYLPLALAQAAAYMVNQDLDCAEYRHRLATRLLHRAFPGERELPDDHQRVINAVWELSIDQADRTEPAGMARPLLYMASVLDPAGIPQQALSSPPAIAYLASELAEPAAEVDKALVDDALRVLHRYSLIDHDRASTYREVRVHQLIQRATRENLSHGQQGLAAFTALANSAASSLEAVWPEVERDTLGQILRANTTALQHAAGVALWSCDEGGNNVLFLSATSLGESGQVAAAGDAYATLYRAAEDHLGTDHPRTLAARGNLARWRGEAGDTVTAVTVLEQVLNDYRRVLGDNHRDTLIAWGNLAEWRARAGNVISAITAFEELLPHCTLALGADHPITLACRQNLTYWWGHGLDSWGAAAKSAELLADQQRVLGVDHPQTLATRGQWARWRGEAGDAASAVTTLEELLTDLLRVLGPDHPQTLGTRANLARWRGEAGDAAGAVTTLEELLSDYMRVLGPDHPDTRSVSRNLAHWKAQADRDTGSLA